MVAETKAVFCCVGGCLNNTKGGSSPVSMVHVARGVEVPACGTHRDGVTYGASAALAIVRDLCTREG